MFTTIYFDFDGVLTTDKTGSYTTCKNIAAYLGNVTIDEVLTAYRHFHQTLMIGQTSHQKIWSQFCELLDREVPYHILEEAFTNIPLNPQILDLCQSLKAKYKLGMITNNSSERMELINQNHNLNTLFDAIIVSGDVGSKKDQEPIFLAALDALNAKAEESVFIDNTKENLIVPTKLGVKTIYFDDEAQDVELLKLNLGAAK